MSSMAGVITLLDDMGVEVSDDSDGEADCNADSDADCGAAVAGFPSFFFSPFSAIYVLLLFGNIIFEIV